MVQEYYDADTIIRTPTAARPRYGWDAWLLIIGHLAQHHCPDAMLRLSLTSEGAGVLLWTATVQWGNQNESVQDGRSFGTMLEELWRTVETHHRIATTSQDIHPPIRYAPDSWLDVRSSGALESLVNVSQRLYENDWHLVFVYQPSELSYMRVQARLLARQYTIYKGGRGATLREACQSLYHNAMDLFTAHFQRISDHVNHEEKR